LRSLHTRLHLTLGRLLRRYRSLWCARMCHVRSMLLRMGMLLLGLRLLWR
jgi:hypothetical protein